MSDDDLCVCGHKRWVHFREGAGICIACLCQKFTRHPGDEWRDDPEDDEEDDDA